MTGAVIEGGEWEWRKAPKTDGIAPFEKRFFVKGYNLAPNGATSPSG